MISLGVFLGLVGAGFVAFNKSIAANFVWSVSNVLLIYSSWKTGYVDGVQLFTVYEIIALVGIARYLHRQYKLKLVKRDICIDNIS